MGIIWRKGGIKSSTWVYNPWPEEDGKTGFYKNRRIIEEPNPLSKFMRKLLSDGFLVYIDGFENAFGQYEQIMNNIMNESELSESVFVEFFDPACKKKSQWVTLNPRLGQMTPRESWVVGSSDASLLIGDVDD